MTDDTDLRIIRELQGEMPLSPDPYGELACKAGCTVEELLLRLTRMRTDGSLKRIGAILRHRNSGFNANGLLVCVLAEEKIEEAGLTLAGYPEVSHCYRRLAYRDWPYNLYAMIHGHSESEVLQIVNRFVREQAVEIYDTLFSTEELKKSSFSL
ncbi:DNA-binding transcriptional regulator, Lrp family [Fontibacillus panacisegetis]|uniref:siroheme decarboxylase n=1 Tax=Fontibacillus panacisegetis TaxID=670482 RepID=A0A1G7FYQ9_9BACL|nr:Lrp/AsnC family transcriptional regulator [Fontibacillus panacisegetis]SDE80960.1 DNA-binding transcriptional regulator, Lrp family [Fontibacillus panacisegetis]